MSHVFPKTTRRARREHKCTWCGADIKRGEEYIRWLSIDEDHGFTNKMHVDCNKASDDDYLQCGEGYMPYDNERPESAKP